MENECRPELVEGSTLSFVIERIPRPRQTPFGTTAGGLG